MIIAGLALAAVIGWTLATVVLYDFDPSRYAGGVVFVLAV
jgi:hypothetical protein